MSERLEGVRVRGFSSRSGLVTRDSVERRDEADLF